MGSGRSVWRAGLLAIGCIAVSAQAGSWWPLLSEDFATNAAPRWTYAGVTNAAGQPLFRHDAARGAVLGEWDENNTIAAADPYVILPSRLSHPLPWVLTDRHTFRLRAVLHLAPGSIPETKEYHQIANVGLYNLGEMGPDRAMADSFAPGLSAYAKDGSDFIEFNYFIGSDPLGSYPYHPSAEVTIGAHTAMTGDYHFNYESYGDPWWHSTAMTNAYLPEGTNLYLEVVYYGAATNGRARRGYGAIYTEPARTNLLRVNDTAMFYWTWPLPADRRFTLTDVAFYNHVNVNWFGDPARGTGWVDDVTVELEVADGAVAASHAGDAAWTLTWAAEQGASYDVLATTDLVAGAWATQATVQADAPFMTWTGMPAGVRGMIQIRRVEEP